MSSCHLALLLLTAILEGSPAPPFALSGGTAQTPAKTPTLIAFLDLEEGGGSSRSQAGVLVSVVASFQGGLRGVVVDASPTLRGASPKLDVIAARVRDWGLEELPVVEDHDAAGLAKSYGVTTTPSVFLLDQDGIVRGRWDRFVGTSELGMRLASLRPDGPKD